MSRVIVYSTFFILSVAVVLLLLISFKVIENPDVLEDDGGVVVAESATNSLDIEDSWLFRVGSGESNGSYRFSKVEIELKLN